MPFVREDDGSRPGFETYVFKFDPTNPSDVEMEKERKRYQKEIKRLEKLGTPYWCIHKDRDVTHPKAYWQDDQRSGLHRKHGVMCSECGGYIQEG